MLALLADALTEAGFEVLQAQNGEDGLEIALKEHPDLILLDLLMPKMDGMTMLKKLREDVVWGQQVPVMILTNFQGDSDQTLKDIQLTRPTYYLIKSSMTLEEIVSKVKEQFAEGE